MLGALLLGERFEGGGVVGTDAHDLGAGGFELRQRRVEVADSFVQVLVKAWMKV